MRRLASLWTLIGLLAAGCGTAGGTPAPTASDGPAPTPAPSPASAATSQTTLAPLAPPSTSVASVASPTSLTTSVTSPAASPAAAPVFEGSVARLDPATRTRMRRASWRPGCPVGLDDLRLVRAAHWGFDGKVHRGVLVVHRRHADGMLGVLRKLFDLRYPVARMRLVDDYGADDDRSMAANNTSAFNCRKVAGSTSWSEHAYGRAIDLNPIQNPYVTRSDHVSPPAGRRYADRKRHDPGMVHAGDAVVRAFAAAGWKWGGAWTNPKDYQHFSTTGR